MSAPNPAPFAANSLSGSALFSPTLSPNRLKFGFKTGGIHVVVYASQIRSKSILLGGSSALFHLRSCSDHISCVVLAVGFRCREKQRKEASRLQGVNRKLTAMNKLLMEENDRLQKQVAQLVYENSYFRQQTQNVRSLVPVCLKVHLCLPFLKNRSVLYV